MRRDCVRAQIIIAFVVFSRFWGKNCNLRWAFCILNAFYVEHVAEQSYNRMYLCIHDADDITTCKFLTSRHSLICPTQKWRSRCRKKSNYHVIIRDDAINDRFVCRYFETVWLQADGDEDRSLQCAMLQLRKRRMTNGQTNTVVWQTRWYSSAWARLVVTIFNWKFLGTEYF